MDARAVKVEDQRMTVSCGVWAQNTNDNGSREKLRTERVLVQSVVTINVNHVLILPKLMSRASFYIHRLTLRFDCSIQRTAILRHDVILPILSSSKLWSPGIMSSASFSYRNDYSRH